MWLRLNRLKKLFLLIPKDLLPTVSCCGWARLNKGSKGIEQSMCWPGSLQEHCFKWDKATGEQLDTKWDQHQASCCFWAAVNTDSMITVHDLHQSHLQWKAIFEGALWIFMAQIGQSLPAVAFHLGRGQSLVKLQMVAWNLHSRNQTPGKLHQKLPTLHFAWQAACVMQC